MFVLSFGWALSLVRSLSTSFNWYASRVYGNIFAFESVLSVVCLASGLFAFAFATWKTQPNTNLPFRKIDYSIIVLLCGVGVYVPFYMIQNPMPGLSMETAMILFPFIAYASAMIAFGELVARLRDKTLVQTLYWVAFFKQFPIWYLVGALIALLLISQLSLLAFYSFTPVRLFALFAICVLTYFATFLLNLSQQYNNANQEKIRAERFKSELITNVSHDIKTPLTSIINYVDLLKKENIQGQPAEYVQVLDKKSARLKILIEDLMEASKAGTGNLRVDKQEINLGELIGQVAGEFEDSFAARSLTLVMRQPEEPILTHTDSRHLYRVLENLFSNAAKYTLSGTRVFVESALNNGKPTIVLQNTSQNPVELSDAEATEQFIRGDKSRQTEGSGLGLYIAKSLVELMGGTLHISIIGDLFRVEILL